MIINYTGISGSRVAYFAAQEIPQYKNTLIIVSSSQAAQRLKDDISFFAPNEIIILPEEEDVQVLYEAHDTDSLVKRIRGLYALSRGDGKVVIAPISSLYRQCVSPKRFLSRIRTLHLGDDVDPAELRKELVLLGYEASATTDAPGEFSMRGDILDIFSPGRDEPVRIEFFDTEIDSIRSYEPMTQRSIENLRSVEILPAVEFMPTEEEVEMALGRITTEYQRRIDELDQGAESGEVIDGRIDRYRTTLNRITEMFRERTNLQIYADYLSYFDIERVGLWEYLTKEGVALINDPSRLMAAIPEYRDPDIFLRVGRESSNVIYFTPFPERIEGTDVFDEIRNVASHPIASFNGKLDIFAAEVRSNLKNGYKVVLVSSSEEQNQILVKYLMDADIFGAIETLVGSLSTGMRLEEERICYITESDIFPTKRKKPLRRRRKTGQKLEFSDLHNGDYVVHETYGIGRYEGIETLEMDGEVKDYLKIHYAGTEVLYIPTEQLDIIQRYIGNEGNAPRLSKISGGEWKRTRERVRKSIMEIAEDLVRLYAERQASPGYAFAEDDDWQRDFETAFPYTETEDQLKAIAEIKEDMQQPVPMDRLLCGDVGYGKTEVAARAIFKCLAEGKQAVMLAPTTLLVNQHYNTLKERFEKFPFNVEMLSRFRTDGEQKKIIKGLRAGSIDLVIGTHRLFSEDIAFKDLGLLVIDEEQRFGVKHKEQIKKLRKNIDVLTLSATPIPRTLNMSLTGIKSISTIDEPPEDRLPVQTYVTQEDEELIQSVLQRELARGGQAYVIFNRVKGIRRVAEMIQDLVPDARVGIGHGRMDERTLENVMVDFVEGRTNVLVSTTIVENGIDVPNANTIIILDADKMGLSQLYQLKGRVGRSSTLAYAYLTYKPETVLTEIAMKRLVAIREFTEFGSGFKLAMKDLELRGAGNVLGEAQHGHIEGIGYELYCKEVDRAVRRLQGEDITESRAEMKMELSVPAWIPSPYIEDETLKLQAYKKIAQIENKEDAEDILEELMDRYGDLPEVTLNLIRIAEIRASLEYLGAKWVREVGDRILVDFYPNNRADAFALVMATQVAGNRLSIGSGENPSISLFTGKKDALIQLLEVLRAMRTPKDVQEGA